MRISCNAFDIIYPIPQFHSVPSQPMLCLFLLLCSLPPLSSINSSSPICANLYTRSLCLYTQRIIKQGAVLLKKSLILPLSEVTSLPVMGLFTYLPSSVRILSALNLHRFYICCLNQGNVLKYIR